MRKTVLILLMIGLSVFAKDKLEYTHKHKPCICDKPVIFDDTPIEKIFEFKGDIYKVLKGDETNPSILYVLDPKTDKFIQIKQK
ncbi:hypothetical protein ACFLR3_00555 [Campylobacterota bacterium]